MANPAAEHPSLPQPATSLQPPSPARDPSPRIAPLPLPIAVVPASAADDYDQDIYAYLRSMESAPRRRPAPDYMALHTKRGHPVTPALRAVLVEWLSSLAPILHFESRTLHLAVLCLDRFLSTTRARPAPPAVRSVRVLITITAAALLIACKYEEVYPADVEELVDETSSTHGGCTREELLAAEVAVLKALRHELGSPTACTFLELFMERLGVGDQAAAQLTSRLIELSLLDYGILRFRPSVVAASAILIARMTARPSDDNPWCHEHERATGYTAAELKECAERLNRLHQNSIQYASLSGFENMRKKYSNSNFKCVWTWPPLASI
ncbi:hypothetical protein ACQ4PT_066473 [Festuca glaucescens]